MASPLSAIPDEERDRAIAGNLPPEVVSPTDDEPLEGEIVENPDGTATLKEPEKVVPTTDFSENLAESLDAAILNSVATDLIDLVGKDKTSREKRDEQYEDGLRRTGLGDDAPGGADFDGASRVVHPVLAEACVDFGASAMKELCPPDGPVKITTKNVTFNPQQRDRAGRKRDLLNELFVNHMTEYYDEKEVLLSQLPLGGSQYETYWYDAAKGRACMEFWPIDKCYLPYAATSFYTAGRKTRVLELTKAQFEKRIDNGMYRDIALGNEPAPEESLAQTANDKIEGKETDAYNEDGLRTLYEIKVNYDFEDDSFTGGENAPYIITIDEATSKVVSIYRNWDEADESHQELEWDVEDKFIPWRGVYAIGLPHLIGSLAASLTGALRALLDSAHINNTPAAVKLKGGRTSGSNTTVNPTEIAEMEAPPGVDDIRKLMMPMPYNQPSPVLFQLLGWLTDAAKGVVSTAEEKIADAGNNMPVGTAMALIEQGSKVYSSIHARLHKSQARGIKIVCRLIKDNPNGRIHKMLLQKYGLTPQDFADWTDIEPVSDPNIFSESQRYAQWQSAMQLAAQAQQSNVQVDMQALVRRGYELLRWPDIDTILPKPPQPITADPVTENQQTILTGAPIKAVPEQDHLSHIQEHLRFILDPMGGAGPLFQGPQLQNILANITQHMLFVYSSTVQAAGTSLFTQARLAGQQQNPETMIAGAAQIASQLFAQQHPQLAQQLDQAFQVVAKKMPPGPQDPVAATLQAAMAETNRKAQQDKATNDLKSEELKLKQADQQMAQQEQMQKLQQWLKEQNDKLAQLSAEIQAKAHESAKEYGIEVERIRQGYIELEQNAAKIGLERMGAINDMLAQTQERIINPLATGAEDGSVLSLINSQNDQHAQTLGQLSQHLSAIHDELKNQNSHRQQVMGIAQSLLQEP